MLSYLLILNLLLFGTEAKRIFFVKSSENCIKYPNLLNPYNATLKSVAQNVQLLNGSATVTVNIDNYPYETYLELKVKNKWNKLYSRRGRKICVDANTYLGPYWHEMQRLMGLKPGTCPVPARFYNIVNLEMDFNKQPGLATLPTGETRWILLIGTPKTPIICFNITMTNSKS